MTQQFRIFLYACLAAISSCLSAQAKLPTMLTGNDSVPLLRGVAVSYDLAGTIMRLVSDYGQFEGAVRVNLKDTYFPTVELGLGSAKHDKDPITGVACKTVAPFARIGCDVNVAKNKHDDYRVLLGARYAFTSFKQEITGEATDPIWGSVSSFDPEEESHAYHWAELLFGVDAKIAGPIRLGWTFRYKRKIYDGNKSDNQLWYIPGYGKSGNVLGGTFNVTIQLGK